MWHTKKFKTKAAFDKWVQERSHNYQWEQVFVNTSPKEAARGIHNHAVTCCKLRWIG